MNNGCRVSNADRASKADDAALLRGGWVSVAPRGWLWRFMVGTRLIATYDPLHRSFRCPGRMVVPAGVTPAWATDLGVTAIIQAREAGAADV